MIIDSIDWTTGTYSTPWSPSEHLDGLTIRHWDDEVILEDDLSIQKVLQEVGV